MASPEKTLEQMLRIIDANLNRIGEGLRFLEEVARLVLNDTALSQQLKTMRHEMVRSELPFHQQLLQARNSEGDVGADMEVPGEGKHQELPAVVVANARRVQEALRVMEELAKVPETNLHTDKFRRARFDLYTIERELLSRLLRREKIKRVAGLCAIIDTEALRGRSHIEAAGQIIRGGAAIIQLRDKLLSKKELLPVARQLRDLCVEHGVLFIVNDHLDLALTADADGLHLGQDDLPVEVARKLLPMDKILGCSARTVEQATAAESDGADYIGVGSMCPSPSKETSPVVGLEQLRQIKQAVSIPIVAIGGITKYNVAEVIAAGASSAAVISAILQAEDIEAATVDLVSKIEAENEQQTNR